MLQESAFDKCFTPAKNTKNHTGKGGARSGTPLHHAQNSLY